MKLLIARTSAEQYDRLRALFESAGIPVYSPPRGRTSLWICIDEQYEDALQLMKNSDHMVASPVNVQDFYSKLEQSQHETPISAAALLALLAGLLLLALIISSINSS